MNRRKPTFKIIASGGNTALEITAVKKGTTAYIGIKGGIYRWTKASSYDVETIVKGFVDDGAVNAEIYLNTPGGDCFETAEILNIVDNNFKPENVKNRIGAVAASAGTRFLCKYYTTAKRNSQIMIHKPMGAPSGNEDEIEAGLKLVKNITQDYKTAYATKMGISEADVEKLWAKGDYWMTATEALKKGLIDAIEDEDEKIDAVARMQLVACGAPVIPKIENNKNHKNNHMELSVLAVKLGLPSTASQAEVDAKLDAITAQAATADGLVRAAADKKVADEKAAKKGLLDKAEQDKKITAAQRPHLETMDVEALTAVLGGMQSITAISEGIDPKGTGKGEKGREAWTFADYQEKDPTAFDTLDEAAQKTLIDAHYKDQ